MNCYKALSYDGKVIVVEAILPFLPATSSSMKVTTHMDVEMMTQNPGGKEHTYDEFIALAKSAGFRSVGKISFFATYVYYYRNMIQLINSNLNHYRFSIY